MRYRSFPGADVTVSEVGFGTRTLATGWWGERSDDEAVAMLRRALDERGVTFFDAADTYGNGRAERQLASAFKGRRSEVVIGTKVGYDIYDEAARESRRGQNELPMRTDPVSLTVVVGATMPLPRPANAVTSLNVEPGAYWPWMARLVSG